MEGKSKLTIAVVTAGLATAVLAVALYAQDKYSLTSPSGIEFSDFKAPLKHLASFQN